jgi:hypothetical protein
MLLSIVGATSPVGVEQQPTPRPILLVATDAREYVPGATITFSVALDNPSDVPVTLSFPSEQRFDLAILSEERGDQERELWRWAADRDFADSETEQTFLPGVTLLGRVAWNGRDASGNSLPPGEYRAVGTLPAMSEPRRGNDVVIRLSVPSR